MYLIKDLMGKKLLEIIDLYTEINAETVKKSDLTVQASISS